LIGLLDALARPLLGLIEAEQAHALAIGALKLVPRGACAADDPRLALRLFGLDFPNPVAMAAGFDKHGEVPDALIAAGFGFVEIGTVTLRPQSGNPRPRLFRLPLDQGIINRLGFNSEGGAAVLARLEARAGAPGIVGVNVGANKESPDRIADYASLIETFAPVASYFTVNISSPNTPGLRELQQGSLFDELLARVLEARDRASRAGSRKPLLIKIAPDLTLRELDGVLAAARRRAIDGMISGNTTITRPPGLRSASAREAGGLSGVPLFPLATRMLAEAYLRLEGAFPLIGTGGIDSGETAPAKVKAGASALQLYSGLVFRGLRLIDDIKAALVAALVHGRHASLAALVGRDAAALTREPWPL
jgi:dihydroorotate dehydrogenase